MALDQLFTRTARWVATTAVAAAVLVALPSRADAISCSLASPVYPFDYTKDVPVDSAILVVGATPQLVDGETEEQVDVTVETIRSAPDLVSLLRPEQPLVTDRLYWVVGEGGIGTVFWTGEGEHGPDGPSFDGLSAIEPEVAPRSTRPTCSSPWYQEHDELVQWIRLHYEAGDNVAAYLVELYRPGEDEPFALVGQTNWEGTGRSEMIGYDYCQMHLSSFVDEPRVCARMLAIDGRGRIAGQDADAVCADVRHCAIRHDAECFYPNGWDDQGLPLCEAHLRYPAEDHQDPEPPASPDAGVPGADAGAPGADEPRGGGCATSAGALSSTAPAFMLGLLLLWRRRV